MNRWEGPTRDDLRLMARRSGCRIAREVDGCVDLLCASYRAKVAFLDEMAWHGSKGPRVRRIAEHIASQQADGGRATVEALHAFVRDGVLMLGEGIESFSPALRTLLVGVGDCDDKTIALLALLRAIGATAAPATLPPLSSGRPPLHVAPVVQIGGKWLWLETTLPGAAMGEHPLAAAKRLGIAHRKDLVA